jgi:hypothetical protein
VRSNWPSASSTTTRCLARSRIKRRVSVAITAQGVNSTASCPKSPPYCQPLRVAESICTTRFSLGKASTESPSMLNARRLVLTATLGKSGATSPLLPLQPVKPVATSGTQARV